MKKISFAFTISATLPATPAEVFDALTNSEKLAQWSGAGAVAKKVGGRFSMFDGWVSGKVLAYDPPKKLGYTWKTTEWADAWPPSEVSYTFTKVKTGTKVTIEHTNLPNQKEADEHRTGWAEYVFDPLADFLSP